MNENTPLKTLSSIQRSAGRHWVGNGFPVRTLFSYNHMASAFSPFLLLDYAGPVEFPPTRERLGVGEHPHRGFETVTIVYHGEVEHRDSSGGGGKIGPGDVQWMTAAAGLVHEEFHGRNFARDGGIFQMVQLWVNLPAKDKFASPGYQEITTQQIPTVELEDAAGSVRVIAGEYAAVAGPARTFTPIEVWDVRLKAERTLEIHLPDGYTTVLVVLDGRISLNGEDEVAPSEAALLTRNGERFSVAAAVDSTILLLSGAPIDEPIVGSGPFVMNTSQQIHDAISDYQSGKMGHLA